jgi:hypothetical protein
VAWVFILAFGGLAVAQASWVRNQRRDLGEMLAERAASVGGRTIDEVTIEVARRGVAVRVELVDSGLGTWGAQATASRRLPVPGRVTAGRRSFRGLDDVVVHGVTLFSDDVEQARRMWSAESSVAWRRLPQAALIVDGATVTCTVRVAAPRVIAALVDLVAILAAWDDDVGQVLGDLPGACPLAPPALGVVLAPDGVEVRVDVTDDGPRLIAELGGVRARGELPSIVRDWLARAGLAGLRDEDDGAVVTWLDVERDPARIRAGVAALRALAGRFVDGPYR